MYAVVLGIGIFLLAAVMAARLVDAFHNNNTAELISIAWSGVVMTTLMAIILILAGALR